MKRRQARGKPLHVVPVGDIIEHDASARCDCSPKLEPRTIVLARDVWVHRRVVDPKELN